MLAAVPSQIRGLLPEASGMGLPAAKPGMVVVLAADGGIATEDFDASSIVEPREIVLQRVCRFTRRLYDRPVGHQAANHHGPAARERCCELLGTGEFRYRT